MIRTIALLSLGLLLFICSCSTSKEVSGPAAAVQTTHHKGVGTITALNPKVPSVEIDHEDIPGLMPAMQMEFHVKDKSLLNNIQVGNHVEFTVENGVGGMEISEIRKI